MAIPRPSIPARIERAARPIEPSGLPDPGSADLSGLLERIGDARLVLLGEATHGTAEFYDLRARISQELIAKCGFDFIAVEADWPDAARIDRFVRDDCDCTAEQAEEEPAFGRFPTWMWVNRQVLDFVTWLRGYNESRSGPQREVGFFGLDLYSIYASIDAVIRYLETVDAAAAEVARHRYGCLTAWGDKDPATYGAMAASEAHLSCEREVLEMLDAMLEKRLAYAAEDGRRFLDAVSNARLLTNAERYYREMYRGTVSSWNLRDRHMFDSLQSLLEYHGENSKGIVWAHNSHLGDASATDMGVRGEFNLGQLCREAYGRQAYRLGFGTHTGTVAAASHWGGEMEIKRVRPSLPESYEHCCHESGPEAFLLPLRDTDADHVRALRRARLERAIGVIYRPETERASHYFKAALPRQFDEYAWFDETRAVDPLTPGPGTGTRATWPFGV